MIFLTTTIGILAFDALRTKRAWHDPLYFFLIFHALYVSPLSIRYLLNLPPEGNVTHLFYEIESTFPYAVVLSAISNLIFYCTYCIKQPVIHIPHPKTKIKYSYAATILLLIGGGLFLFMAHEKGGVIPFLLQGYGVTGSLAENPLQATSFPILFTAGLLYFYAYIESRRKPHFLMSLGLFLTLITMCIIMGRRAEIAVWGLIYLINFSILFKRIKIINIIALAAAGFIFLNFLGIVRQSNYEDIGSFQARISEKLATSATESYFYTVTSGQFAVPFESLPILMDAHPSSDFRYGTTVIENLALWVPRVLWEDKPYGLTRWFYQTYYDPSAPPNEGRAFFFLSEGYLNFGIVGVVLWAALWGLFWKSISNLVSRQHDQSFFAVFVFSVFTSNIIKLIAGDSGSIFVAIPKQTILWFLLAASLSWTIQETIKLTTRRPA